MLSQQTVVDELYTTLYTHIPRSLSRLTVDTIVPNWENAQQEWDSTLRRFDLRLPVGAPNHTHNHPHDTELEGEELIPEQGDVGGFRAAKFDRPPTYISTLDIPAPIQHGPIVISLDQSREEENLRQAYSALGAWMEGAPKMGISGLLGGVSLGTPISPITPSPMSPHGVSSHKPSVMPCPLDRKPHVDAQEVPISQYRCFACRNPSDGNDLKTCSGCRKAKYCDEHW